MATVDTLRNKLIDKLPEVKLTEEQILILQFSDKDIETGKLISQEQLDENELEWLQGK